VSQIVAVVVLGLVLATARATDAASRFSMSVTEWGLAATAGGVVCGLLFGLFIGRESDASKIFLATIGLVTFASGLASALGISSLFVNLVAGLTVSLISPHAPRLQQELDRLQHVLFVLLMIFAGALWVPVRGALWLLPLLYVAVRFVARRLATAAAVFSFAAEPPAARRLGNGLLGQGSLALAVAVEYSLRLPAHAPLVLTTVLIGALLSDLWSLRALRTVLADAGELGPAPGAGDSAKPPGTAVEGGVS
jgi:Kef-type K+ transport system membrane component KefB